MTHEQARSNEIHFLQEQNRQILHQLEEVEHARDEALRVVRDCEARDGSMQAELQGVKDKIDAHVSRLRQDKSETIAKDEHVRVLSDQNKQMLTLLETEENKSKERGEQIEALQEKNKKLQRIAEEFDAVKAEIETKVAAAKNRSAEIVGSVKGQRSHNETLRANIQNTEAKTRVDIESLQQALAVVESKNLEYLTRINKQETREQQLQGEIEALKQEVEEVRDNIDALRAEMEGDSEGRSQFERHRSQMEMQIEALEVQADTLKKALNTAERANEQLQDENRTSAERCRETADKIYALTDSLRLNQVELKKQEEWNSARDKKLLSLERQIQSVQAKIAMEVDAKVLADQERKEAEQEGLILKKKNKKIEENLTHSQQEQEKAEKAIAEMNEKVSSLQTQNAYLASRIDGQEEEKNAAKADIKKAADRLKEVTSRNGTLRDAIAEAEEKVTLAVADKENLAKELEYIKREDVLDEAGRQRPVLIQSTESDLLEKLQINEFLYEAQQARNPVPPLVEKIAQLLAMLHDGQARCDQYLADLSKSNGLVSALRQRNVVLFSRTQMFESFKTRALLRYVMNIVEAGLMSELFLDGLNFGQRELGEMIHLLQRYEATDKVYIVSLVDNGLDEDSVNLLLQLIYALPYVRRVDLRRNCVSADGVKKIEEQCRSMEGVTGVIKNASGVLNVHSGNQLRFAIDIGEQVPKESVSKAIEFSVDPNLAHEDADPFLKTSGGGSDHPWVNSSLSGQRPGGNQMMDTQRSTGQAVPDPSSMVDLPKPAAAANVLGGPPVGLGGPGNLASLNKKPGKGAPGQPKAQARQARRAKAAPPPPLTEYVPNPRIVDKWQTGGSLPAAAHRALSDDPLSRRPAFAMQGPQDDAYLTHGSSAMRALSKDRLSGSASVPALKKQPSKPGKLPLAPVRPRGAL